MVSAFLLGLGLAQPLQGPLADRYGRRRLLLASFSLFVVASLGCAAAGSAGALVAFRFLQSLGASAGTVVGRAMIRDVYELEDAARVLSWVTTAMALAPAVAPPLGGLAVQGLGWRAPFALTAALGAALLALCWRRLPETRPGAPGRGARRGFALLLRSPSFLGYSLIFGCGNGAFFAFLASAPAIATARLGVAPAVFGLYWTALSFSYMAGAAFAARLLPRVGSDAALRLALSLMVAAGLAYPPLVSALPLSPALLVLPMAAVMFAAGIASPIAIAGAVGDDPRLGGTAAGLSSAIGMAATALFSTGLLPGETAAAMAANVALAAGCCGLAYGLVRRQRSEAGPAG